MPTGSPSEFESSIDRVIREAMESGDFDDLPGAGQRIPGTGTVDDEGWWIRSWVERNRDPQDESSDPD
jgi:hypothetical protein